MRSDLDVFSFELASAEKGQLDSATSPAGKPSFMCASAESSLGAVAIPTVKLNNGVEMPMMSLGTWQYDRATAQSAVSLALKVGFTHIDTANNYHNQEGVGAALKG